MRTTHHLRMEENKMFRKKKDDSPKGVEARIRHIQLLSGKVTDPTKKKRRKSKEGAEDGNAKLYKLMNYLHDELPEVRIAAAKALQSESQEVVVTHLCWYLRDEKDENVIKAIKETLASVRANMAASGI